MAKRNVCILESFFSLGATDEGRWHRSWSIAALMLLIRDRSRAFAVCLCLLKPVSLGFLRRLLFLLRVSLLSICFRSRGFSTTILLWYSGASRVKSWRAMNRKRDFWIWFLSRENAPSVLFKPKHVAQCVNHCETDPLPQGLRNVYWRKIQPYSAIAYIHVSIGLQRRSRGFQLWNRIIGNQISGRRNLTTLLRPSQKKKKNSSRETKRSQCYVAYLLSTWEVIHWNNWTKSRQERSVSRP